MGDTTIKPAVDIPQRPPAPTDAVARMLAAEDTLRAIGAGEIDTLVISDGGPGQRVVTLSSADRLFRNIVENMREGAATLSPDGLILYANRRLAELLSCPREAIVGSPLARFLAGGSPLEMPTSPTFNGPVELELDLIDVDGVTLPVLVAVSSLDLEGHLPTCLIFTDLSGPKAQQREIVRLSRTRAQQMVDLRGEYALDLAETQKLEALGVVAGGIAHDFNNLLTVILGNVSMALDTMDGDAPERAPLQQVRLAALRSTELAQQMLAYSGQGKFVVEVLDLAETVSGLSELIHAAVSVKAEVSLELGSDTPLIEADVTQLRQVVLNLITNASEAIGEAGGTITVRTGRLDADCESLAMFQFATDLDEGIYAVFEVTDTGPGMDAATKDRIFDPFFTTKFTGRGLGLAAVQGVVRGHHGAMKVETEPGIGTIFTLIFPASYEPARRPPENVAAHVGRMAGTVLVVDDDDDVRRLTARMLESLGFSVVSVVGGAEALTAFREREDEFAFVLLDLMMPGMSGDEVIGELRRIRKTTPIILASGYNSRELSERFVGHGVTAFLQKPYQLAQLKATAAKMLAYRAQQVGRDT